MNNTTGNFTLGPTDTTLSKAYNFINLFLGLPTNGYVLWLILSGVGGSIESEFFALNLTVSDLLYCVSNIIFLIFKYHPAAIPLKAVNFFKGIVYVARPLFQTCISLERYLAVVHPVVFLRYKLLRYKLACCSVAWLLVISSCVFSAFIDMHSLTFNVIFASTCLVLLLVQLFFCLSVLRVLRQSGPGEGGGREREGGESSNIKSRAFKIILLILITTLITFIPFVLSLLLWKYLPLEQLPFALLGSFYIAIVGGLVHPLLFLHRTGKLPCLNMAR